MSRRSNIRVLVVDDSAVVRTVLREGLSADPRIVVVGTARDAYEARDQIVRLKPDVMTLDVDMPRMDGVDFLRRLMPQYPLPVVMVSSATHKGNAVTVAALEAGAVDVVAKPSRRMSQGVAQMMAELRTKVKIASTANVSHWKFKRPDRVGASSRFCRDAMVALGASTGGIEAIRSVLKDLPADFPPIVIVQHMPSGFTRTFAGLLNDASAMQVREAQPGDELLSGRALVAPGGRQIRVVCRGSKTIIEDAGSTRVSGHCPSVDVMMGSAARACGKNCFGVLLTGMGADGARGMLAIRQAGGPTVAQDEATSVVFGMPREAWYRGGVETLQPIGNVAAHLVERLSVS